MEVSIWTVYEKPSDYPLSFVARRFVLDRPTTDLVVAPDLESVRNWLQMHAHEYGEFCGVRLERDPLDEPQIVEGWL